MSDECQPAHTTSDPGRMNPVCPFLMTHNDSSLITHHFFGEVQEWLKWQRWKCCERETVPWVRIPPSPPFQKQVSDVSGQVSVKIRSCISTLVCFHAHYHFKEDENVLLKRIRRGNSNKLFCAA